MEVVRYTEAQLFNFAFAHERNLELLDVLISDFGLNVNWRKANFYDTLLYQSLKMDLKIAKYLISKGACVNASLGGYPTDENSHGNLSILDVTGDFMSLKDVGGANWLKQFGAISFEKLPADKKDKIIATIDFTTEASSTTYISRTVDQVKLSQMSLSEKSRKSLDEFISNCRVETINTIKKR